MKIVVLDRPLENPGELDWSALNAFGDVTIYDRSAPEEVIPRIGDAEIVMLNKAVITEETLNACPNIRFISVIATGYNTVDVNAAAKRGIPVANVPSYGTEAIAQHAIALLMEITNHVAHHDAEVRKLRRTGPNDWCFWDYPCIELAHKTMGIIGLGRIGHTTAAVGMALGMKVIAHDMYPDPALEGKVEYVSLDELYSRADVIFLHCPLFPETQDMINSGSIAKMKDGVILINNSRGGLVVEKDLAEALHSGKIAAAGLDAIANEPIDADNPLLSAPNVFFTPHISWAALECRQRLKDIAIENVRLYLAGTPRYIVNAAK
ncbi:MAG: D-2-hydroxyacid dehydrogenase [Clostridia bacterium]|nr:D-2-hydroxyacid dehydrogenase [Clostridia bacterium]